MCVPARDRRTCALRTAPRRWRGEAGVLSCSPARRLQALPHVFQSPIARRRQGAGVQGLDPRS